MARGVTIAEVARRAGVSTATVSRALGGGAVGPETRERVLVAVRETGYRANGAARDLRRGRARAILVLVPNLANPFFSAIIGAVAEVAAEAGLAVQVSDTRRGDARLAHLGHDGRADGVILLDGALDAALVGALGLPVVTACEWVEGVDLPGVAVDNAAGAASAVAHLLALGHRRVAHVAGPPGNVLSAARVEGWREAAGARAGPLWPGHFTLASGAAAARRWLACDARPTAVACASDECAMGFVSELARHGVAVPGGVSVARFDDIELAARYVPALTTVRQPRARIGEEAARLLVAALSGALSGEGAPPPRRATLPTSLVVRASTAPPPP